MVFNGVKSVIRAGLALALPSESKLYLNNVIKYKKSVEFQVLHSHSVDPNI